MKDALLVVARSIMMARAKRRLSSLLVSKDNFPIFSRERNWEPCAVRYKNPPAGDIEDNALIGALIGRRRARRQMRKTVVIIPQHTDEVFRDGAYFCS